MEGLNPDAFEKFVSVLALYGPSALIILALFFSERKARMVMVDAVEKRWSGKLQTLTRTVWVGNWVAVAVLAILIGFTHYRRTENTLYIIEGKIVGLRGSERILYAPERMYLRPDSTGPTTFDYDLVLLADRNQKTLEPLKFSFKPEVSDRLIRYQLVLPEEALGGTAPIEIHYLRDKNEMALVIGGKRTPLEVLPF